MFALSRYLQVIAAVLSHLFKPLKIEKWEMGYNFAMESNANSWNESTSNLLTVVLIFLAVQKLCTRRYLDLKNGHVALWRLVPNPTVDMGRQGRGQGRQIFRGDIKFAKRTTRVGRHLELGATRKATRQRGDSIPLKWKSTKICI